VWLYGVPALVKPVVTAFSVSDQSCGSAVLTDSATVNVSITASVGEGQVLAGLLITETGDTPSADAGWALPVDSYTITGAEGAKTLYAWAKDDAGNIGDPLTAAIYFSTAIPKPSTPVITDNLDGTATVAWTTDIVAEGGVNYGPVKMDGTTPVHSPLEGTVGKTHSVTINVPAGTNYKIVLVNNEKLSSDLLPAPGVVAYWPSMWPVPCDVNRDCKVNILDLIFIRNRLNQLATTGDNILADVNTPTPDGKINILDLIAVRNRLNMNCPQ